MTVDGTSIVLRKIAVHPRDGWADDAALATESHEDREWIEADLDSQSCEELTLYDGVNFIGFARSDSRERDTKNASLRRRRSRRAQCTPHVCDHRSANERDPPVSIARHDDDRGKPTSVARSIAHRRFATIWEAYRKDRLACDGRNPHYPCKQCLLPERLRGSRIEAGLRRHSKRE
jgi:hypothetical protein